MDDPGCLLNNCSTDNTSSTPGPPRSLSPEEASYIYFVNYMELIGIPLIVVIGLTGNFLSAFIFLQPKLRKHSCSLYLAARAISDSGFLICIFILWLQHIRVSLIHTQGICQIDVFLSYLCGFLSVWFIVWVTVENYYRICQPFNVSAFCTVKKAMFMILMTSLIGCMIYSFSTWTNGIVVNNDSKQSCGMIGKYEVINTVLTYCDCLITMAIPSAIILLITGRIIYSIMKTYRKGGGDNRKGSGQLQTKVSRMLFCVSLTFLVLNLPSHVTRLRAVFEILSKPTEITPSLYLIQRVLQMIYYLSFAVNFFIYVSLGPSFRTTFITLFCRPCLTKTNKKNSRMELKTERTYIDDTAENLLSQNGCEH